MSKVCISNCINDLHDQPASSRTTYVNLHRWPESEAEFVKLVGSKGFGRGPRVVDSISCRQIYLRSYKFSKKETVPEKTKKCLMKAREKMVGREKKREAAKKDGERKCVMWRKMKEVSCTALFRVFLRLLSCAATVDVVEEKC